MVQIPCLQPRRGRLAQSTTLHSWFVVIEMERRCKTAWCFIKNMHRQWRERMPHHVGSPRPSAKYLGGLTTVPEKTLVSRSLAHIPRVRMTSTSLRLVDHHYPPHSLLPCHAHPPNWRLPHLPFVLPPSPRPRHATSKKEAHPCLPFFREKENRSKRAKRALYHLSYDPSIVYGGNPTEEWSRGVSIPVPLAD